MNWAALAYQASVSTIARWQQRATYLAGDPALDEPLTRAPLPAAGAAEAPVVPPRRLAIYYGWPSLVNESYGDPTRAAAVFASFDLVVFGDGLEHPTHGDHDRHAAIIERL